MKRIFDPIHDFIEIEPGELALLQSRPLQRLRHLKQLGLAYLAFPAAEHSRFGHAIGALAMGERALSQLFRHDGGYFSGSADYELQRRLLRASLLLHDVGHGPFSHACEAVLGIMHEQRTRAILALPEIERALAALAIDPADVLGLVLGGERTRWPVLAELVSGPNLDADRMDYLLRDAYFTGVGVGRYDAEQLLGSLRVLDRGGQPLLGVDRRGVNALETFVLARYQMFSTVYFHHTTRQFERILHGALREIWPDPRALDPIDEFLAWDDARAYEAMRLANGRESHAVRYREPLFALVAEFNAERDLTLFARAEAALRERYGDDVWSDAQEQLMHRLPLGATSSEPTILVRTRGTVIDAREASDLIARVSGKAYWRKLYVRRSTVDVREARALVAAMEVTPGDPDDA